MLKNKKLIIIASVVVALVAVCVIVCLLKSGQAPSIKVSFPAGGEALVTGSTQILKWSTRNVPASYQIAINIRRIPPPPLQEEGQEFDPIVAVNLPNTGSTGWTISDMYPEGNYVLGFTAYAATPITNPISVESAIFHIGKSANWSTYTNKKYGYSVAYPPNWTFREFPDTQTGAGFRPVNLPDDVASECVSIDARSTAENEYNTPFADYVKRAGIVEIQGFEKLDSIKPVTAGKLTGYETTWLYKFVTGEEKISLPITYFENKRTVQTPTGANKVKTVQIMLGSQNCLSVYNQMLPTFKLTSI